MLFKVIVVMTLHPNLGHLHLDLDEKCPVVLESLVKENRLEQQYQNTGVKRVIREEEG